MSAEPLSIRAWSDLLEVDREALGRALRAAGARWRKGPNRSHLYAPGDALRAAIDARALTLRLADNVDYEEAKRRKTLAEAQLVEMELGSRVRRLVPHEIVADLVAAEYARVRARLAEIPGAAAKRLFKARPATPAAANRELEIEINRALADLSSAAMEADLAPA